MTGVLIREESSQFCNIFIETCFLLCIFFREFRIIIIKMLFAVLFFVKQVSIISNTIIEMFFFSNFTFSLSRSFLQFFLKILQNHHQDDFMLIFSFQICYFSLSRCFLRFFLQISHSHYQNIFCYFLCKKIFSKIT